MNYQLQFTVSALRCYSCKGNNHEQCKHVKNLEVEECASMNDNEKSKDLKLMCSKIVLEGKFYEPYGCYVNFNIFFLKEGKNYIRGCVKVNSKHEYCESNFNYTKDAKCYFCDSNLCNGSGKSAVQLVALAFGLMFVFLF